MLSWCLSEFWAMEDLDFEGSGFDLQDPLDMIAAFFLVALEADRVVRKIGHFSQDLFRILNSDG